MAVLLNALDGFDVLSISFASPGIARDWGVDRAALGLVLSMELIGMAVGSILLGQLCDRIGRRPTVLGCLIVMATGMALAATATDIRILSVWRLLTGVGIGGMLAATNTVVAEFANAKRRNLAVVLMAAGYPVGAVLGGTFASVFLVDHGWRWVFGFGAIVSALCVPLAYFLLPETVAWLTQRRPRDALARINRTLRRIGHPPVDALPPVEPSPTRPALARLFTGGLAPVTLLLTLAYFAHIMTFYFILKWAPKIVADFGFAPSSAGSVLVWANVGGIAGSFVVSLLTQKIGIRTLTLIAMVVSTGMVALFGRVPADLAVLSMTAAVAGFFTNGAVVGLYAMFAQSFPTSVRAGGTGFVIGIGRGGAALSPIAAGFLFANGFTLPTVALLLGGGSIVAAVALILLPYREGHN
jgi:benzoate transport